MKEDVTEFVIKYFEKKKPIKDAMDINCINYLEEGFVDSLGLMKFIVALEEKFDIEITEEDMEKDEFYLTDGLTNIIIRKV